MKQDEPIIFAGWEKGIAPSPYTGLAEAKNVDLSTPGVLKIAFKTSALNVPPAVAALAFSTNTTTDVVTVASTSGWYNGMAITLNTIVTSTGISTGRVYWVGDLTATTFKLYKNPSRHSGSVVDITGSDGSGTLTSYTFGEPVDWCTGQASNRSYSYTFIMDTNNRAWWIDNVGGTVTSNLVYLGNDTLTGSTGRAIRCWKNHLILFRGGDVDGLGLPQIEDNDDLDASYTSAIGGGWSYGWDGVDNVTAQKRSVLIGQDDIVYYAGDARVGSFTELTTVDLDDGTTYAQATAALDLPEAEEGANLTLGELGQYLLVVGKLGKIYPWDRGAPSHDYTLPLTERTVSLIVSANNRAYLFAGTRGKVYVTDGTNISLFKSIPDHLAGAHRPIIQWHDALVKDNELYFSFTASENDGDALAVTGGVWAIDLETGALRYSNQLSYGDSGGVAKVLIDNVLSGTPAGHGLYVGWVDGSTYGVDVSTSTYYTGYAASVTSDMQPVGTAWHPRQLSKLLIEFNKELASGEGLKLYFRTSLSGSWTLIDTFDFDTYGAVRTIERPYNIKTEKIQWKVELTSGGSTTPELMPIAAL